MGEPRRPFAGVADARVNPPIQRAACRSLGNMWSYEVRWTQAQSKRMIVSHALGCAYGRWGVAA